MLYPSWFRAVQWVLSVTLLGVSAACGDAASRACNIDADCASGVCTAAGICEALGNGDSDVFSNDDDVSAGDDGGTGDSDPGGGDDGAGGDSDVEGDGDTSQNDGDDGFCQPNRDGVIARSEIFFSPGLVASFRIARGVEFATAGTLGQGGMRIWDFTSELPGDQTVERGFDDPTEAWWYDADGAYGDATHTTPVLGTDDLTGIYRATEATLRLLGVAAIEEGLLAAELVYDPPLATLHFPLTLGDSWDSDATVSGWLNGAYSLYWENATLEAVVDAEGIAVTELASFPVLRVRSTLTRQTGVLAPTTVTTFAFVSECYGTVAWVLGEPDDDGDELETAAEVGRIVP